MNVSVDPMELELVGNALRSVVNEMALTVARASYSTITRDAWDFSTGICDAQGQLLAQGLSLPLHYGSLPVAMGSVLRRFQEDIHEGDIFILNDPFEGGTHLPDIFLVKSIFVDGELSFFVVEVGHHIDIGGRVPGGNAADSTEVYQEGLRLPPIKLFSGGVKNEAVFRIIEANVRVPEMVFGDLQAKLAALETGERGVRDLVERYGLKRLTKYAHELMNYSERLTRKEILELPDGRYFFEDFLDDDGVGGGPVRIAAEITITGDELIVDFAGTSPQTRGALNVTLSMTQSASYLVTRCILGSDIPINAGFFRPISVKAEPGSLLNAVLPAASGARGLTLFRIGDTLFGAFAQAVPERVFAAGEGGTILYALAGNDGPTRPWMLVEVISGAWGGRPDRDGVGGITNILINQQNLSIELLEREYPMRVTEYGFVPDSGGAGRFRGGPAMMRELMFLGDSATLSIRADRRRFVPYGLLGGKSGSPNEIHLIHAGTKTVLATKSTREIRSGDVVRFQIPGAGGYGDPMARSLEAVLDDYLDELITVDAAADHYGVVIDAMRGDVDIEKTAHMRMVPRGRED
jgi:N-methylhydantoinase B